ncbi:MAG: lysophospholipid acyltransferase family protein [candidate division Zixibacteria bacterium]|nr:lysophospholipid acyltransferase family protein [candidate division Zixibacteria bacterium]
MRFSKRLKRTATFCFVRALTAILNLISRRMALFTGSTIGLAAWSLLKRDRYRIFRHLTLVYGDHFAPELKNNIGRNFFVNSGKNLVDAIRFRKHFASEIKPLVIAEGLEHLDAAYRRGKGLIAVSGHLGNFELGAVYMASLGYQIAVIGREMDDHKLNRLLVANRQALGLTNLSTTESPRKTLSWLKAGGTVGILIDTDSFRVRSTFVPAFGRLALTPIGMITIGLKAGAAFVPIACVRTDDNRYRIIAKPEVRIEPSGDFDTDIYHVTAACTKSLEAIINENVDQWIWLKNRWLTSPQNRA